MGHFYSKNFSEAAIRLFETNNLVTIRDLVTVLKDTGQTLHAAEGEYSEDHMLSMGAEQLFFGWAEHCDCIEPCPETKQQRDILTQFEEDCSDFDEEEYAILDSIEWQTTGEDMPVIDYIPS